MEGGGSYGKWAAKAELPQKIRFDPGKRVVVRGSPHMPGQSSGTVEIVKVTDVYGIKFDGMDEVHKWYVGDELKPE